MKIINHCKDMCEKGIFCLFFLPILFGFYALCFWHSVSAYSNGEVEFQTYFSVFGSLVAIVMAFVTATLVYTVANLVWEGILALGRYIGILEASETSTSLPERESSSPLQPLRP